MFGKDAHSQFVREFEADRHRVQAGRLSSAPAFVFVVESFSSLPTEHQISVSGREKIESKTNVSFFCFFFILFYFFIFFVEKSGFRFFETKTRRVVEQDRRRGNESARSSNVSAGKRRETGQHEESRRGSSVSKTFFFDGKFLQGRFQKKKFHFYLVFGFEKSHANHVLFSRGKADRIGRPRFPLQVRPACFLPFFRVRTLIFRYALYRYTKSLGSEPNEEEEIEGAVLSAVLLDEWLKELAAIAQEHTFYSLSDFS